MFISLDATSIKATHLKKSPYKVEESQRMKGISTRS
jgi:hypothetical protein